jgi:LuxR family maltose regulon positive regulatory protein
MPKVIAQAIIWLPERNVYVIREPESADFSPVPDEESEWFAWLAARSSFAFQGQHGHLTLRREIRARREAYWYAYRCQNQRTIKRYVGKTNDLAIPRLEEVARDITVAFSAAPAQEEEQEQSAHFASHASTLSLLTPKLRLPQLHTSLIVRERLLARLDASLERKLTVLCAPAGFGKTTLVRQWIAARSMDVLFPPVAWVSLDAGDNDPVRFWRYVLTACQTWSPAPDHHALTLLLSSTQPSLQPISLEMVLTTFLNELVQQGSHGLLLLEDYHLIAEPRIHETLTFFLTHLPETLHIVLMTRHEPPLPLVRLRANGDLNEIQATDLRFSHEEMAAFLHDFPLSTEALERLDAHLEGWAAGLRLLFLSLQGKGTPSQIEHVLSTFSGSHRPILDYFVTEVLHAQPEPLQDFLLRTSVLTRLSPSLCAAVTSRQDSAALLETIERAHLFLEALEGQDSGEWYRYHALFAEAMQHEARRRLGEEELRALSHAASCWFEQHGLLPEAIEASLKMGENVRAAALIEQLIQTSHFQESHEYQTLRRWLEQLPEELLKQSPLLCSHYAVALIFGRTPQQSVQAIDAQVEELLHIAEERWRSSNNLAQLGELFAFRSIYALQQRKREQGVVYARHARAWLLEKEYLWRGISSSVLGIDALFTGQFDEARSIFEEINTYWKMAGSSHATPGTTFLVGMIYFEQGELHQAARHYRKLWSEASPPESQPVAALAHLGLAQVYYEWNDLDMAEQQVQETLHLGAQFSDVPNELLRVPVELMLVRMQHAQGETALAMQRLIPLLSHVRLQHDELHLYLYQEVLSSLVLYALSLGDHATAQYWLNDFTRHLELHSLPVSDTRFLDAPADPVSDARFLDAPADEPTPVSVQTDDVDTIQHHIGLPTTFLERKALLTARLFLAQGEPEAALSTLDSLLPAARAGGRGRSALQITLLMAQAYAAAKQFTEARQLLLEGLEQGHTEGYQRIFLDEGDRLFTLLRDLFPHLHRQSLRSYAQTLLHAFAQAQNSPHTVVSTLFEPLSPQEQRVLRLLAAGRSNPEIASELVVSVNTIRTHVQRIYRKLNVNSRVAAIETARRLQLL